MAEKHRQAIELLSELRRTKEKIEMKSGKVKPDVLYSLLQVRIFTKRTSWETTICWNRCTKGERASYVLPKTFVKSFLMKMQYNNAPHKLFPNPKYFIRIYQKNTSRPLT
jgi:hypothetical protein